MINHDEIRTAREVATVIRVLGHTPPERRDARHIGRVGHDLVHAVDDVAIGRVALCLLMQHRQRLDGHFRTDAPRITKRDRDDGLSRLGRT